MTEFTTTKIEKLDEWLNKQIDVTRDILRSHPAYPHCEAPYYRGRLKALLQTRKELEGLRNDV